MALYDFVRLHATKSPDATALADISGFSMTYAGLADSVDLWARLFSAAGIVVSGQRTPIFLHKSANIVRHANGPDSIAGGLITIILAIMRAGAVAVPIETSCPSQRIKSMLEQVQDKRPVLTTSDLVPNLPAGTSHVCIDTFDVDAILVSNPELTSTIILPNISAHDPAYVTFTSETNGVPKGILVPYRAVYQCCIAQSSFLGLDNEDPSTTHRILQLSNYTVDAFYWDISVAFAHGYTLCTADQRTIFSDLPRIISALRVSIVYATPTIIQNFLMSDDPEHDLSSLDVICVGGETMKPHVKAFWQDRVRLFHCYGQSGYYICMGKRMVPEVSTSNIGRPFGDNRAYVLRVLGNGELQKVAPGEEGSLYLAGPQISLGYINDAHATRSTFLNDPFVPGEHMYKTGDQVVLGEDGVDIHFGGPQYGQLKLCGVRLEVDEIECIIQTHSRVRAVAVDIFTIEGEQDQLGAFISLSSSSSPYEGGARIQAVEEIPEASEIFEDLRSAVLEKLSEAMTPTIWIPISHLPFDTSGILDRQYLRTLVATSPMDSIRTASRRISNIDNLAISPLKLHSNGHTSGAQDDQLQGLLKHLQAYTPAEFPLDKIRPASMSFTGDLHTFHLSKETLYGLEELSKQSSATLDMTLLAALRILHYRYTDVEDAVLGSPVGGHSIPAGKLLGNFLVVRIPVEAKVTLASVLSETRLAVLTSLEYSEVPFLALANEMHPIRDLSRHPIVQLVLALHPNQPCDSEMGDVSLSGREIDDITRMDMEWHFRRTVDGLKCDIIYSSSLFRSDTIRAIATNFSDVIDALLRSPHTTVAEIPFIHSLDQLAQAQVPLRAPPVASARGSLVQQFRAAAADHRDLIALIDENITLTYHELDRLSDVLAQKISNVTGANCSHDIIAFCIPPSALAVLAIIAILKHGAAYLPLDVRLPDGRLHTMLSDSKASVLITTNAAPLISLVDSAVECLDVTEFLAEWQKHLGLQTLEVPSLPTNELAYVLYTSGSTGKPKGVAVTQQSVLALVNNKPVAFRPGYRVAQTTNLAFDPSTIEIWGALLSGATLVCFDRYDVLDPVLLANKFKQSRIDFCIMSPTLFRQILDLAPQLFKTLHTLMLGGESVHYGSIRKAYDENPMIIIQNAYGPTEATVLATYFTINDQNDVCESGQVPIGCPTATCQALVLDVLGRLVPPGVIGELYIGGEGVSSGYLGYPTHPSFSEISIHELAQAPSKFYRSGDAVRWRTDGQLEFIGRRTMGQVKIRGQRLEIGEVESAIIQIGLVHDAAVIAHKSSPDADPILIAYVVSNAGNAELIPTEAAPCVENWTSVYDDVYGAHDLIQAPHRGSRSTPLQKNMQQENVLISKIKERLQIVLPSFMLPEMIYGVSSLPMTVNGKLDRRQLEDKAALDLKNTSGTLKSSPVEAPKDDIEMRICKIFEEMLSRRPIETSSDFFSNGGHSLLATRLKSQIEKTFRIPFTLRDVFNLPTPMQIANKIRETYSNSNSRRIPVPILVGKRDEYRPLSFAQERLWFLDQLYPGNRMYHIPLVYNLEGELDEKKLRVSIEEIVGRHEVLRSVFVDVHGIPKQKVLPMSPVLQCLELMGGEVDASRVSATIQHVVDMPFRLGQEPAFRATLLKLGPAKYILAFSMHHIISDDWSIDLLRSELVQIYTGLTRGIEHGLPVPKIQYSDFAEWQRSDYFEAELRRQADYWQTHLIGSKPAEFPADCPRPALLSESGDHYEFICGPELEARLELLCRATNTTMFMVLMAAFRVLHYRLTGDEDASFGSLIANRHHHEVEEILGFFTNTQVMRIKVTPGQDFTALLHSVRQVALDAFENQDMPFEKIVSLLQPVRDSSRNPVIQTILAYQTVDYHEPFSFSGINASILELDHRTRFDLQVHFSSTSQGLKGLFVYSTDLFSPSTMKHYAETMRTILEEVAQNPKSSVDTLYLGPPALLQPESVSYLPLTLQELFCATASRNPDVIALQHGERYWTYQHLDRCTNAIALDLLSRFGGGKTGNTDIKTVGVFIDNSAWTVIAMLSILKAGWAYIPIDIRQPEERMHIMLAEAGSNIVLLSRDNSPPLEMPDVDSYFVDDFDQTPATDSQIILPLRKCDDLACIIFTSGSTGTPKGILIEHRSIVRIVCDDALLPLGLGSRMAQVSNLGFDPSGLEIWGALCRGATLICYSHMEVLDVEGLSERFQRDSVDSAHLPTPMFAYALEHVPSLLQHLTLLLVGGEAMTKHHLALFDHMDTDAILINAYGPAENGIVSTFYRHHPAQVLPRSVVVGKPVLGTAVAIIDDSLCPVPEGVMGEICVFGAGLARGYVRLVQPNPFLQVEVAGVPTAAYRTGDLGRLWKGQLEYLSRRDTQVKIRGQRIEIGEIEQNILNSGEFSEAVVVVQVNTQGDKQLVAYATAKPAMSQATSASALLRFLAQKLPKFMIPAAIHVTEKLPLTANGKVDRRALSAIPFFPASVDSETLLSEREPKNPLETIVLDAYTQVLGLEGRPHINLDDSFFDLGGHSLLLTQLVALLRSADERTSHASLPLVFENTTPRLLAARLSKTSGISVLPELSIENVRAKDPSRTIFPASGIMKRFWMLQEFFSDSTYSLPSYRQTTGLSLDVVEQEFSLLCREHSIFRTNLVMSSDGELQQHISDQFIPKAHIIDLRSCPDAEARMQSFITKDVCTPFELSAGPLIRLICFDLDDDVQLLHLNVHHCIADMTSTVLFWNTLLERTRAFMRDGKRDPSLIQNTDKLEYVDFTMDQIARMNSPATKNAVVSYWHRQLSGVEPLSLPTLRAPLAAGITGGMVEYTVSFQIPTTFEKFCTRNGASDFSGFLAVIQTLLARYSSSTDFGILVPMSVRSHIETHGMFGCFLETAIIRNQAQLHKTFTEVVLDTVRTVATSMENLDMTFEEVLHISGLGKDAFPVMFVYLTKTGKQDNFKSIPFIPPTPPSAAKFPLTIVIERQLNEVECVVNFDSASIAADFALSIGSHVKKLIQTIIAELELPNPAASTTVGQLDILSNDEEAKIYAALRTVMDWDDKRATVNDLLRCGFSKTPEKVACNFEGTMSITYRELDIRVGKIAQALRRSAVVPEATIAVLMDASIERIVAILAIVRSGAAYVPLDTSHPANRLAFIIGNSDAKLVITSPEYKTKLVSEELSDVEVTDLDSLQHTSEGDESQFEPTEANLCYILYTSGSTGQPKGVQVEHRSLVHAIHEHTKIYELTSDSKLLQFAAYTFDVSVIDIFATLACGATLCLGRKDFLLADLASAIRAMKVTHIATTPTVISLLDPEQVPTLKVLAIGGEPMTKAVRDTWAGERNLKNVYGPTECTVNVISRPMTVETPISSIGKPLGGVQAHIINDYMCQAPIGVVGQLAISGPQVSRGYLNNPEASKAFVYDKSSGARLYLTGDLARLGFDGNIECLGRMDGQIKLRGLRIELGEIDAVIASHTTVTAGTTLLLKTKNQGEALVAFIVPQSSTTTIQGGDDSINLLLTMRSDLKEQAMNLRSHLLTTLPEYFIPTYWLPLRSLPTNVNGKVDKKVLSSLFYDLDESTLWDYTANFKPSVATPQRDFLSEKELILSSIWSQVLGLESGAIPVDVSFFSLGGDSISAIRLAAKVRQQALAMNPKDIYSYPTIRALAMAIELQTSKRGARDETSQDLPIGVFSPTPVLRWFLTQREDLSWYNMTFTVKTTRSLEPEVVRQCWLRLVQHHDCLRLRILDDNVAQIMPADHAEASMLITIMNSVDEATVHGSIREMQARLDPRSGVISALGVFNIQSAGQLIFMSVHHAAVDLVSWRIILADMENMINGEGPPTKTLSYRGWSNHLSARHPQTSQAIAMPVPVDMNHYLSDRNTYGTSERLSASLPIQIVLDLTRANETYRTETVDLLLASFLLAWTKWAATDHLSVLFESHGRFDDECDVDITSTVGWFTNLFDLTFSLADKRNNAHLISQAICIVKEQRRNTGWRTLVHRHVPGRGNVTFNYTSGFQELESSSIFQPVELPHEGWQVNPSSQRSSVLDVTAVIRSGELDLGILFSWNLHHKSTIERLLELWRGCLIDIINHCKAASPTLTPSDVPLLLVEEDDLQGALLEISQSTDTAVKDIETILPCTDMQTSMLLASQCSDVYMEYFDYTIAGNDLTLEKLQTAWRTVAQRHCLLRSTWIDKSGVKDGNSLVLVVWKTYPEISSWTNDLRTRSCNPGTPLSQVLFDRLGPGNFRMQWAIHHAIVDGWSTRLIMHDFQQAYDGNLLDTYGDFQVYLKYRQVSSMPQRSIDFWKTYLAGLTPTALLDPAVKRSSSASISISEAVDIPYTRILNQSKAHGVTVSTLLRAALALTLSRYVQQDDVFFGVVVSGRNAPIPGIEQIVGPLINTQPFRVTVSPTGRLVDLLQDVDKNSKELIHHEQDSLHSVLRIINQSSDLLQVLLVYQNYPTLSSSEDRQKKPFTMQAVEQVETTDVPFCIVAGTLGDKLHLQALARTTNFTPFFTKNFLLSLSSAIQSFAIDTEQVSTHVSSLHPRQSELLRQWSNVDLPFPIKPLPLFDLVQRSALLHHELVAVEEIETGKSITYRSLVHQARVLAIKLVQEGLNPRDVIAIQMDKSINMVVAVLAATLLGAYVPIDMDAPAERKANILKESNAKIILVDNIVIENQNTTADSYVKSLAIGPLLAVTAVGDSMDLQMSASPNDTAYILFTSGSTGKPKGVEIQHQAASTYVENMKRSYGYTPGQKVFGFARLTFDISVTDIFSSLSAGATLCLASQQATMDDLNAVIRRGQVQSVNLTPTVASLLNPEAVPSLKTLILAGEAARRDIILRWARYATVLNSSGPTEAAVTTVSRLVEESDPRNVGKAVPGVQVYVLDRSLRPTPPGAIGRVFFGGIQLARGYINRPDLTCSVFVNNPISGGIMYDSGDLGAYDEGGNLLHLGRSDGQVKINGQRVELQEIEAVFNEAMVSDAEVVVSISRKGTPSQKLFGFLHTKLRSSSAKCDPEVLLALKSSLVKHANKYLPGYMIPSIWVCADTVPRTASGKIDRRSIVAQFEAGIYQELSNTSPGRIAGKQKLTPVGRLFLRCLQDVLGDISKDLDLSEDIFSHYGLDSFGSMRLVSMLRQKISQDIHLQWIIDGRTFENIVAKLETISGIEDADAENTHDAPPTDQDEGKFSIPPVVYFSKVSSVPFLFCIHPASGLAFQFAALSRITSAFNVVALNDPDFASNLDDDKHNTIPKRAVGYYEYIVEALAAVAPESKGKSSMNIMGYSFGGHLGVEVARLAQRDGWNVNLFVIDSAVPNQGWDTTRGTPPSTITDTQVDAVLGEFDIPDARSSVVADNVAEYDEWRTHLRHQVQRNLRALVRYTMEPYTGHLTLFRTEKNKQHGYQERVASLDDIVLRGTHFHLLDEPMGNLPELAKKTSNLIASSIHQSRKP